MNAVYIVSCHRPHCVVEQRGSAPGCRMLLILAGIISHSPHDSTDAFASTPDGQHLWVNSRRNRCVTASPPLKLPPAPSASDARGLSTQARREAWSSPLHRPCPGRRTLYRSDDTGLTWQLGAD